MFDFKHFIILIYNESKLTYYEKVTTSEHRIIRANSIWNTIYSIFNKLHKTTIIEVSISQLPKQGKRYYYRYL